MDSTRIWVNGRLRPAGRAVVSALDRGFMLGDGLFETMRARDSRVLFLDAHLARLRAGAAVLDLPLPAESELRQAIMATLQANALPEAGVPLRWGVVRLTVTRGPDAGRGLDPIPSPRVTIVVRVTPFMAPAGGEPAAPAAGAGLAAVVATLRRNEYSPLSRLKSCSYGDNVLARQEARARGAAEALLLNSAGEVACAAAANVVAVIAGVVRTPPIESGVLPGVTRRAVLDLAAQSGLRVAEEPFGVQALRGAEEAFLTNTVIGVRPLTQLDGQPIGSGAPGPLTVQLAADYERLVETVLAGS